jgi:hypothetical protein
MKIAHTLIVLLGLALVAGAQPPAKVSSGAAFDQLKTLAGEWEATTTENGQTMSAPVVFRLASGGSVLMSDLAPGTSHEMITMIHRDGDDLLATHYCLTGNQPRMRAVLGDDANSVAFEVKDITNLAHPGAPHMVGVKFTLIDANHHIEEWTVSVNGQTSIRKFDCRRKA